MLVVGGGPAGLEAARVAAERGHAVTLHEATAGARRRAAAGLAPAARRELWELVDFQVAAVQRAGVEVVLGSRLDAGHVRSAGAEAVVATGARPRPLALAVAEGARVLAVAEAIALATSGGASKRVVIIDDVGHFPAYVPARAAG